MARLTLLILAALVVALSGPAFAQDPKIGLTPKELIQHGPMVCHVDIREAHFVVQTRVPAKVQILYTVEGDLSKTFLTEAVETQTETACVAKLVATGLTANTRYTYMVFINGKALELPYPTTFKTQQFKAYGTYEPADFSFVTGSGSYVNDFEFMNRESAYGGEYEIYLAAHKFRPDLMFWLGDNVYFQNSDWNSWNGMLSRYTHSRSIPELQPLLASTAHYAVWDDHDYGPNNSDRSFHGKHMALDAFKLFFRNPSYGVADKPSASTHVEWEDVAFFMLDNRTFRTPNNLAVGDGEMATQLGEHQRQWLIESMKSSYATFKIVVSGGQFLSTRERYETWHNTAPQERQWIIDEIGKNNIRGVVFLNGDRHFSEVSKLEREGAYTLYDYTVSPFNSGAFTEAKEREAHDLRVEGSCVTVRNFAMFRFSGPKNDRALDVTFYDSKGAELYKHGVKANDLK